MATREEIEAQIAADPYDDAAYLILADVLQLEGDPRGELIAIDALTMRANTRDRAAYQRRRQELLQRHPELDFKPVSIDLEWHLGFVRRVRLHPPRYHVQAFEDPAMRFLAEIVLPDHYGGPGAYLSHIPLARSLRMLALGEPEEIYWSHQDSIPLDLEAGVPQLPQLERLSSNYPVRFRAAPRLRTLELRGGNVETLRWLHDVELPVLERLMLHLRVPWISIHERDKQLAAAVLADFEPLLSTPPTKLSVLELIDVSCGDALVRALATSPLLRQLRTLRLWNAGITVDGARHITREAFGHLELLDLSDPALDDATIAMVEGVCRDVRTLSPRLRELLAR